MNLFRLLEVARWWRKSLISYMLLHPWVHRTLSSASTAQRKNLDPPGETNSKSTHLKDGWLGRWNVLLGVSAYFRVRTVSFREGKLEKQVQQKQKPTVGGWKKHTVLWGQLLRCCWGGWVVGCCFHIFNSREIPGGMVWALEKSPTLHVCDTQKFQTHLNLEQKHSRSLTVRPWKMMFWKMLFLFQGLGGGFKYLLFSSLFGEDFQFD